MRALSLVIPCYNEAGNLPRLVARCAEVFDGKDAEVVLVDNGSRDDTAQLLPRLIQSSRHIRTTRVEVNRGYGAGILAGLRMAHGRVLAWTHADLQTDPADALRGLELFAAAARPDRLIVKGRRYGRPLRDVVFMWGMSACEVLTLGRFMWDINAQPTMFSRDFFAAWHDPPEDFSLDLYAYYTALESGMQVARFPVLFGPRVSGTGHHERLSAKLKLTRRTVSYSLHLRRRLRSAQRSG